MNPTRRATAGGLAAIVLWSTSIAFGRSLSEQLGPLTAAALIHLAGGGLGLAWQAGRPAPPSPPLAHPWRYRLGCGSLFVTYMACLYGALGLAADRAQVLEVGLINYLWPALTVALSVPILRLHAGWLLLPGLVSATAGVVFAMTGADAHVWATLRGHLEANATPDLLALAAAVSWALYSILSRRWAGGARSGAVAWFMLATGAVLGLGRGLAHETSSWTGRAGLELGFMVIASNAAYYLWEYAMRNGDVVLVAASSYFTPLLSTLVTSLYLGVTVGGRIWVGCAGVLVGAVLCRYAVHEPRPPADRTRE